MCAGLIIHRIKDYQDIRKIGFNYLNINLSVSIMMIANIRLCGLPFLRGFYSKDLIIEIVDEYEKLNKTNIEFKFINDNSTKDNFNIRGQISFLRQAIQNIIDNAVSFSKYGDKIIINLSSTSNYTSLSISDNGPGIKEPIFEKIFERFIP